MGSKAGAKKLNKAKSITLTVTESLPSFSVLTEVTHDPYQELRYSPTYQKLSPKFEIAPATRQVAVLKKKPNTRDSAQDEPISDPRMSSDPTVPNDPTVSTVPKVPNNQRLSALPRLSIEPRSKEVATSNLCDKRPRHAKPKEKEVLLLSTEIVNYKPMTRWVAPSELPAEPEPIQVLRHIKPTGFYLNRQLEESQRKQANHLARFEKAKDEQLKQENHIMSVTGKYRESLLLRKKQLLPNILPCGEERSLIRMERAVCTGTEWERDFVNEPKCTRYGLTPVKTKRERGFTLETDWVGCPEVTDVIFNKLGISARSLNQPSFTCPQWGCGEFVPSMPQLGVVNRVEHQPEPFLTGTPTLHGDELNEPSYSPTTHTQRGGTQEIMDEGVQSHVGLVLGNADMTWSQEPERKMKTWVIEMGCVASLGKNEISSIKMTNTGTTAIYFNWQLKDRSDTFQLDKYKLVRFVFDNGGGVILPGETFRIPFVYRSIEQGFYSQDWLLLTRPVLENGAEIILRLWGVTHVMYLYRDAVLAIDKMLEKRQGNAIVQHRVEKIINYLPLKEVPLKEKRFLIVHEGPDLFCVLNPRFKYHTAEVFRLGKMLEVLEITKQRQEMDQKFSFLKNIVLDTSIKVFGNTSDSQSEQPDSSAAESNTEDEQTEDDDIYTSHEGGEEDDESMKDNTTVEEEEEEETDDYPRLKQTGDLSANVMIWANFLEKKCNPDARNYKKHLQSKHEAVSSSRMRVAPVNLTNYNISVDELRTKIFNLENSEQQEAFYDMFVEETEKLFFSPILADMNWMKLVVGSMFGELLVTFEEFATTLKAKCLEGQAQEQVNAAKSESNDTESEEGTVKEPLTSESKEPLTSDILLTKSPSRKNTSADISRRSTNVSFTPKTQSDTLVLPKDVTLTPHRYKNQYYDRIYCRMYQLLSELVDKMDTLFAQHVKNLQLDPKNLNYTKVRDIPLSSVRPEDMLEAPLPPAWVRMAQRMDTVQSSIKERRNDLEL